MEGSTSPLSEGIQQALQAVEFEHIQQQYWAQNECVVLEHFLPDEVLEHSLLPEAEKLRAHVHRNYIPRHKKGGSVIYYTLVEKAPAVLTLYRHPAFIDFLSRLVGAPVMPCPEDDPHACALYFYTEPGDHIVFTMTPPTTEAPATRCCWAWCSARSTVSSSASSTRGTRRGRAKTFSS